MFLSVTASGQPLERRYDISVPAARADVALKSLARQAETPLLFSYDLAKTVQANAVSGRLTLNEALKQMFRGTGLSSSLTKSGVITVTRTSTTGQDTDMSSKKTSSILGIISVFLGAGLIPHQSHADEPTAELAEIIVTAEKRDSTIQKTPISITAISGDALTAQGTTNMLEVAQETPGVSFRTAGPGQTEFEVRGLASSGGATATVGYYLDDIPISPPAIGDIGKVVIDPTLYDLNRVEVLRGPQGTLYGAGSMGGTIKVITNPAEVNSFESTADGTFSSTDGGGNNWAANAMLNVPLVTDKAALRLVVSSSDNDGWIDRIVVHPFPLPTNIGCTETAAFYGCARGNVANGPIQQVIPDVNWVRLDSARMNVTIQPSDRLKITAMAMYQGTTTGGYSQFDAPPGPGGTLAHYQPFNTPEPSSDYSRLSSITVTYDFSGAKLTSATSYWNRTLTQLQDLSETTQNISFVPQFFPNVGNKETDSLAQFSQEIRLTSTGGDPFQWLVGGFFSYLRSDWQQYYVNAAAATAIYNTGAYLPITAADNPQGLIYVANIPYDMKQEAVFTDLSYQLSPSLKLSVGARYYRYDSSVDASQAGIFAQSVTAVPTVVSSRTSANGFNPKMNLSYTPNDDLTLYGTIAKGFRPGGVNLPLPAAGPLSCTAALAQLHVSNADSYDADSVWSYELGEKTRLANGRITINGAIYYIRWNDIQQLIPLPCGYFITQNAGQARSYGSELEIRAKLTSAWEVTVTGGYTNATINDPTPYLGIAPGSPVLNIPKYTASAAATYSQPLNASLNLTARAAATYTGSLTDEAFTYVELPSYTLIDARIGITADRWKVYISGENLTNKIAELSANNTAFTINIPDLTRISTNQPRTIGVNVGAKF
jgi:outer membrane receptor protein involved in Fe transport